MKKTPFALLIFILFTSNVSSAQEFDNKGVIDFLHRNNRFYGEFGQVVNFSFVDSTEERINVIVDDDTLLNVRSGRVVPFDPEFTVSWAFLVLIDEKNYLSSSDRFKEADYRIILANNILKAFPVHLIQERILELRNYWVHVKETIGGEGIRKKSDIQGNTVYDHTIRSFTEDNIPFLEEIPEILPDSTQSDRNKWALFKQQNYVYEFEFVSQILEHIPKLEKFLSENPDSKIAEDIKYEIAKLYRRANEHIVFNERRGRETGVSQEESQRIKSTLLKMFRDLLQSNDLILRETARANLYNISRNRRYNINRNAWGW